ncbi:MAG: hypothetical protein HZR80_03560 [Candidatus Heimdallarchaeota archaeon]
MKEKSIVGEPINFRGLVYSPIRENGVIFLFGMIAEELNIVIEEIKISFPDCIARRFIGHGKWEKVRIEFEIQSKNFVHHGHNPEECDIIVCWEHNWSDCPIEVLELKKIIKNLPNEPREDPDMITTQIKHDMEELFKRFPDEVRNLFENIDSYIKSLSDNIWSKPIKIGANYYSPKRVFISCTIQKQGLKLTLFTRGENIKGIERTWKVSGEKWGNFFVRSEKDLVAAKKVIKNSYSLIKEAIEKNEPTGWYAPIEDNEEEL